MVCKGIQAFILPFQHLWGQVTELEGPFVFPPPRNFSSTARLCIFKMGYAKRKRRKRQSTLAVAGWQERNWGFICKILAICKVMVVAGHHFGYDWIVGLECKSNKEDIFFWC